MVSTGGVYFINVGGKPLFVGYWQLNAIIKKISPMLWWKFTIGDFELWTMSCLSTDTKSCDKEASDCIITVD